MRKSTTRVILIWLGIAFAGYAWFEFMQPAAPVCPPEMEGVPGARLLYRHECGRCHTIALPGMNGKLGPRLRGLGSRSYIEESLREPSKKVVRGYLNAMPSYAHLSEAEVKELVDYLITL